MESRKRKNLKNAGKGAETKRLKTLEREEARQKEFDAEMGDETTILKHREYLVNKDSN